MENSPKVVLTLTNNDWMELFVDGVIVQVEHKLTFAEIQDALKPYPDVKIAEIQVEQEYECVMCGKKYPDDTLLKDDCCPECW
jgi:hypothetical protein